MSPYRLRPKNKLTRRTYYKIVTFYVLRFKEGTLLKAIVKGLVFCFFIKLRMPIKRINSYIRTKHLMPGRIAQLVTFLTADMCLTADPGVTSLIQVRFNTFMEIDHDIFYSHSPPFSLFKKGCCQLQAKAC